MNHIRRFLSYKSKKNPTLVVKESVLQVDDVYKVRVIVDVKKSMVNSYIKKVCLVYLDQEQKFQKLLYLF